MKLVKSLLLGSAAGIAAVAGASAADLPSRKAAPASYVKICDAFGAGFFFIPGTDTCVRLGGYVRAEYQYVPGRTVYQYPGPASAAGVVPNYFIPSQVAQAQDTSGMEMRGRIDVDARTQTEYGTARTFIRLRGAATSGLRAESSGGPASNAAGYPIGVNSNAALTVESALIQWAGFTFGVAPENYAFMPSVMYHSNPWAGFPNGMQQIAYTAVFGGGLSATIAIENRGDWAYAPTYVTQPQTGYNLVGNIKWDQPWGFAVLHGLFGENSLRADFANAGLVAPLQGAPTGNTNAFGPATMNSWAIGVTTKFNLPMLGSGDVIYFTANYAHGALGALSSAGGMSTISGASNKAFFGGILRNDNPLVVTSGNCTGVVGAVTNCTVDQSSGWNVATQMTHYWAPRWRSNFTAGYIQFNPPTSISPVAQWGQGRLWEVAGSLIYSPAKDFDIGLEVQYANLKNSIQTAGAIAAGAAPGASAADIAAGRSAAAFALAPVGLNNSNFSTKLRIERSF